MSSSPEAVTARPTQKLLAEEIRGSGSLGASFLMRYLRRMQGISVWLIPLLLLAALETATAGGFRALVALWSEGNAGSGNVLGWEVFQQASGQSGFGLAVLAAFVFAGMCARSLSWCLSTRFLARGARVLHDQATSACSRAPVTYFDQHPSGRILARYGDDYEKLKKEIPNYVIDIISGTLELLWALFLVVFKAPVLLFVAIPCVIAYRHLQKVYVDVGRETQRLTKVLESPTWALFAESISGQAVQVVRVFGRSEELMRHYRSLQRRYGRAFLAGSRLTRWQNVRLKVVSETLALFVSLFCVLALSQNWLALGAAGFMMSLSLGLDGTMQWVTRAMSLIEPAMVSLERMLDLTRIEPEGKAEHRASGLASKRAHLQGQAGDGLRIVFDGYSAAYRADLPPVLRDVSLRIEPGERVGIIGRTGAGKSSLFQALFQMLAVNQGEIRVACRGDVVETRLSDLPLEVGRELLTVVPQVPLLFSGSIRKNLDRLGQKSDADISWMLETMGLADWIFALPGGLDYELNEGGMNLSQGQRQLLCVARAALQQTPVVLLDEATASVDHQTDEAMRAAFERAFAGRTQLVIAHRLETVRSCDRLIAVAQGRIVGDGRPNEVLQSVVFAEKDGSELSDWLSS